MSHAQRGWPRGRAVDGGVDEIPLPGTSGGRLWLCGKHAIAPDPEHVLATTSARVVVCLTERLELVDRYPEYVAWLERESGRRAIWFPVHDLGAPPFERFLVLLDDIAARRAAGDGVVAHCAAGIGRAGTLAVAVLMTCGTDRAEAQRVVAAHRPMAGPEAGPQVELLARLAAHLAGGSADGLGSPR